MDNSQTLATLRTQDTRQINVRENQRVNQEWKIHRHWQHLGHKTNKRERKSKGQSRMDNSQTLAILRTQDTRQINVGENQRVNQERKIHRHWQHLGHKTQDK